VCAGANPLPARRTATAHQQWQHCIAPQLGLGVEVFAAQREGVHALRRQDLDTGFFARWVAVGPAAFCDPRGQPEALAGLPQQQAPALELIRPPSNRPVTARRSGAWDASCSPGHWVG